MAQNYVQEGKVMPVILGSGETAVATEKGYLVGDIPGVVLSLTRDGQTVFAGSASAEGDHAEVALNGVFILAKAAEDIDQGVLLYWDDTAKNVTITASTHKTIGYAFTSAVIADAEIQVLLSR